MVLLENGGFFRNNGLNSLPSVKHICRLLNDPDIFKNVDAKNETVVSFIRKSKLWNVRRLVQVHLDNSRPDKDVHSPIVGVEMYDGVGVYDPDVFKLQNIQLQKHAVVLKDLKEATHIVCFMCVI